MLCCFEYYTIQKKTQQKNKRGNQFYWLQNQCVLNYRAVKKCWLLEKCFPCVLLLDIKSELNGHFFKMPNIEYSFIRNFARESFYISTPIPSFEFSFKTLMRFHAEEQQRYEGSDFR